MTTATLATQPTSAVTNLIDRHRRLWFVLVGIFLALSYNGQWRVGPDSAAYRELGHQLATTGKYFFREDLPGINEYHNQQGTRYPGLPLMLAGIEKLFGVGDVPPLLMMLSLSVITLIAVYRLMLYRVPRWLAVCVVTGMGTNPRFILYSNEILSDVPFLLGVVLTLLGYERVLRSPAGKRLALDLAITFGGLLLAASMRPTFLMLGAALVAACIWGLITKRAGLLKQCLPDAGSEGSEASGSESHEPSIAPIRSRSLLILAMLMLSILAFVFLIDIRQKHGTGIFSGGYESRMKSKLGNFGEKILPIIPDNIGELLEDALPMALLGARSGWGIIPLSGHYLGGGAAFSITILIAGTLLVRRSVLWGGFVFITALFLIFAGPIPRYFLMILPFLLAGWGLFARWVGMRWDNPFVASMLMRAALSLVLLFNIVTSSALILIQRGFSQPIDAHHRWQGFQHIGFLKAFHFGLSEPMYPLAKAIVEHTAPTDLIIGPEANVLTYLSGRSVYEPMIDMRKLGQKGKVHLAIFPANENWRTSTNDYDIELWRLMRAGDVHEGARLTEAVGGYRLSELIYRPAVTKHKKKPKRPAKAPATQSTSNQAPPPAVTSP